MGRDTMAKKEPHLLPNITRTIVALPRTPGRWNHQQTDLFPNLTYLLRIAQGLGKSKGVSTAAKKLDT